mgnify:CR=1 FL=1
METITLTVIALVLTIAVIWLFDQDSRLKLVPIGHFVSPTGINYDLREYFIDKKGNLYSGNLDTWEINYKKKRDLLICSNGSANHRGEIVNSMRDQQRKKATVPRLVFNYARLLQKNGCILVDGDKSTERHIVINSVLDLRPKETWCYVKNAPRVVA